MRIKDITSAKEELKRMIAVLDDAEKRIKTDYSDYKRFQISRNASPFYKEHNWSISGTKESSAVKSSYKVMKYQLDKILR
jgi:hypothetical protein